MAIPFFILAGNFLTHGGVARRMIAFATSMVGHWYGGLGLAGVIACALFAAISGSSPATVVAIGSILLPAMVAAGLPEALRRRRDRDLRRARHPDSALDRDGAGRGRDRRQRRLRSGRQARALGLGRAAVHGRRHPRPDPGHHARHDHVLPRLEERLSAHAEGELAGGLRRVPRFVLGPAADRHRARRHLYRRLHADGSRRGERGLCLRRGGVRLSRHEADATCRRCCSPPPT